MRRKNSLLIPAALALSLCSISVVPALAESTEQTAQADAASDNAAGNSGAASESAAESSDTATESAADTPYEKGTISDTDFQSEWLNLKFTPPETVVMNTEEELQSVMQQGQSTLEESSGVELGEDALSGTVYEMMASSISGFPNVSLVVEDAAMENMTVDQYFLAAQQMLDATGMGYSYSDITEAQIGGQDFQVMETSVTVNDYEVLQKYCTRKQGGKFVSIILSYTTDTTTEADEILAAFTPLNTDTEAAPAE
ncbi:hypothetical protein ACTQWG_12065 [Blautia sp. HCP3S3_H10_1]|uniref:hypothetical protein n=1 Tax=unclassified Blautia TaxID=2648079 RepID=UPI003F917A1B